MPVSGGQGEGGSSSVSPCVPQLWEGRGQTPAELQYSGSALPWVREQGQIRFVHPLGKEVGEGPSLSWALP